MKKAETGKASTQDLIVELIGFFMPQECTKQAQKEAFWAIDELIRRGVITDTESFLGKLRGMFRWDCIPEQYRKYIVKE